MAVPKTNSQGKATPDSGKQAESGARRWPSPVNCLIWLVCALLTLAPIANITYTLATTGADNLCNDYLQYVGLIDSMLGGNYNWLTYIPDTFYRTHSMALPVLIHLADAQFFNWSIYPELAAGVGLAVLRLAFLVLALGWSLSGWRKWVLWPTLALLIFSNSQMSVFCYGDGALTIELSLFGFALGLWALTPRNNDTLASLCMLAGGLIASYSWENGLVTWVVLLVGLVLAGRRNRAPFIAWGTGLAISLFPYVQALIVSRLTHAAPARAGTSIVSFFNWHFFVNALGWPFANNIALYAEGQRQAEICGLVGLILAAIAIALIVRARRPDIRLACVPALLCLLHGAFSIWQISVFRTLIAELYTAVAVTFWIGLVALALVLYEQLCRSRNEQSAPPSLVKRTARIWCIATPILIAIAYFSSNLTYEDKTNLLWSRSPASASALRHYADGPTYRESFVFQGGAGNPGLMERMGRPLEANRLSVFAPHQIWTLQGDYLLDTVRLAKVNKDHPALWTTSRSDEDKLPWSHFKHLNLMLPSPDTVSWTVSIPKECRSAEFKSAVAVGSMKGLDAGSDPVSFELLIKPEGSPERPAFNSMMKANNLNWHDFNFPLTEYRGQTLTLRLSCKPLTKRSAVPAVFRYPYIDVQIDDSSKRRLSPKQVECPSNTELSPQFVKPSSQDYTFSENDRSLWKFTGAMPINDDSQRLVLPVKPDLCLTYGSDLKVDLSDYSHFEFTLAASDKLTPRAVTVSLYLDGSPAPLLFTVPLLADGSSHSYSYDLKLLDLAPGHKVTGLKMALVNPATIRDDDRIVISDVRFVRSPWERRRLAGF